MSVTKITSKKLKLSTTYPTTHIPMALWPFAVIPVGTKYHPKAGTDGAHSVFYIWYI